MEKGCAFRKTGNLVWLCGQDIPPQALSDIGPWDGLKVGEQSIRTKLHHGTGKWEGSSAAPPLLVTEEVARAARDIAESLPPGADKVEISLDTEEVLECPAGPEARSAPGDGEGSERDWSGEEPQADLVQADPASDPDTIKEEKEEEAAGSSTDTLVIGSGTTATTHPGAETERSSRGKTGVVEGPEDKTLVVEDPSGTHSTWKAAQAWKCPVATVEVCGRCGRRQLAVSSNRLGFRSRGSGGQIRARRTTDAAGGSQGRKQEKGLGGR